MNFKESLKRFWMLVSDTSDTWGRLASQTGNTKAEDFRFLYSLLTINAITALAGYALNGHTAISCILNAFFSPAAFYATVWILFLVVKRIKSQDEDAEKNATSSSIFRFIIYASSLNIILNSFMLLFPGLFFLWILSLYTIYLVWEGLGNMFLIDDDQKTQPTAIITSIIIIVPALIMFLMHFMIPGAK